MPITGIEIISGVRSVSVQPGQPIELTYGQKLRVKVSFDYIGPLKFTLHGAIGVKGTPFTEKVIGTATVNLPYSAGLIPGNASVDIPITAKIQPGSGYDLMCKVEELPSVPAAEIDGQIDITGTPPTAMNWLPWAIGGGVVVIGSVIAFSGRRKAGAK